MRGPDPAPHAVDQLRLPSYQAKEDRPGPPDTVKCLGVVKDCQDGLLWLGSLVSVTDRLREAQDLVLA